MVSTSNLLVESGLSGRFLQQGPGTYGAAQHIYHARKRFHDQENVFIRHHDQILEHAAQFYAACAQCVKGLRKNRLNYLTPYQMPDFPLNFAKESR